MSPPAAGTGPSWAEERIMMRLVEESLPRSFDPHQSERYAMSCDAIRDGRRDRSGAGRGPTARRHRDRHRLRPDLLVLEDRRLMATFTVTSTADTLTGGVPTAGTLRWAVGRADGATSASTIDFDLGAAATMITLSQGQLELSNTLHATTIDGPAAGLHRQRRGRSRVFQIDKKRHGDDLGPDHHGRLVPSCGGGVSNQGTVTLYRLHGQRQLRRGIGGGLENYGTATLTDCTVSGNTGRRAAAASTTTARSR